MILLIIISASVLIGIVSDDPNPCVDNIIIQINNRGLSIENKTELETFAFESDGTDDIFIQATEKTEKLKVAQKNLFYGSLIDIFIGNNSDTSAVNISLAVSCQMGYLTPACSCIEACGMSR